MNNLQSSESQPDNQTPQNKSAHKQTPHHGAGITHPAPADSTDYAQAAIAFYKAGKYHKCLEYSKRVVSGFSPELLHSVMQSAFKLSQFHLVWDHFLALPVPEREKCDHATLALVANAAMRLEKFHEAEKILSLVKRRINAPDLPSFDEMVRANIGTAAQVDALISEMRTKKPEIQRNNSADLKQWLDYSFALITKGRYSDAVDMLHTVKFQFVGQ